MTGYASIPDSPDPAPQPDGTVAADVPCRKCGYNLRGLPSGGRCPECGAAVGLSVHGDLLRFSDPAWVRKLRRGAKFVLYGVAVIFLCVILTLVLLFALPATQVVAAALGLAGIAGYGLILAGTWQLTEPDPSGLGEAEYGAARKLIRVALVVGLFDALLSMVKSSVAPPPTVRVAFDMVGFAAGLVGVAGLVAQLHYLKKLSLRLPDAALAARAHLLKYGLGISYGLFVAMAIVTALTGSGGGAGAFGCVGSLLGLALLVLFLMYLRLLEALARRFGDEASVAEGTWASAEAVARA